MQNSRTKVVTLGNPWPLLEPSCQERSLAYSDFFSSPFTSLSSYIYNNCRLLYRNCHHFVINLHFQSSQLIAKEPPAPLALLVIERHVCLIPAPRTKEAIKHRETQGTLRCTFCSERSAKPFRKSTSGKGTAYCSSRANLHLTVFIRILRNIPRLSLVFECQIMQDQPKYTLTKEP